MPPNNRKKWRIAFSIKGLLALTLLIATGVAALVAPRFRREQAIRQLESTCPPLRHVGRNPPDLVDRLLGVDGKVSELELLRDPIWPLSKKRSADAPSDTISADALRSVSQLSPVQRLRLESIEMELAGDYPWVLETLEIEDLRGDDAEETLTRLLHAQSRLKYISVSNTAAFGDAHVVQLAELDRLGDIFLRDVSVTGEGFHAFHGPRPAFNLLLDNCQLTPSGLRQVLLCPNLEILYVSIDCKHTRELQSFADALPVFEEVEPTFLITVDIDGHCKPDEQLVSKLKKLRADLKSFDFFWH